MAAILNGDLRLSQLLDAHPETLDYIVSLNPHDFQRLRNPVLRRYMAARISLARIALMVGRPEPLLLADLQAVIDGEPAGGAAAADQGAAHANHRPTGCRPGRYPTCPGSTCERSTTWVAIRFHRSASPCGSCRLAASSGYVTAGSLSLSTTSGGRCTWPGTPGPSTATSGRSSCTGRPAFRPIPSNRRLASRWARCPRRRWDRGSWRWPNSSRWARPCR